MACISKISKAINYDCDSGATGIISAMLINKEDIESIAITGFYVSDIKLKTGATGYRIDTLKRVLTVSESLKVNEGAPNAFTHSATLTVTANRAIDSNQINSVWGLLYAVINPSANGRFVILTATPATGSGSTDGIALRAYGLYHGMSATAIDRSTHDNGGWYTITMATPERVLGEDALSVLPTLYDSLYASAVG